MKLRPREGWQKAKDFGEYSVWLVGEDDVTTKDDQFFLSWAMVNNTTGRVEGFTSTYTAAYETVDLLCQSIKMIATMENARELLPGEEETDPGAPSEEGLGSIDTSLSFGPARFKVTRNDGTEEIVDAEFNPVDEDPEVH